MAMSEAERQMILDLRRELNEVKRTSVRLRKGTVKSITGPVVKIQMGGDCGGAEIAAVANGPVSVDDVVTVLEGGGGAVVSGQNLTGGESGLAQGPGIEILGNQVQVDDTVARKDSSGRVIDVATPSTSSMAANKLYVDALVGLTLGNIPEVSSLPASPFDGYTVLFNGWLCRYDATPPNANYPWAVVGGRPLVDSNSAPAVPVTSTSYTTVPGGSLSVVVPSGIKGIFDISIEGRAYLGAYGSSDNPGWLQHSYGYGTVGADRTWAWEFGNISPRNGAEINGSGFKMWRHTITTAGATVTEQAKRLGGASGTHNLGDRALRLMPVWIGT